MYLATRTWRAYGTSQGNVSGTVLCLVGSARSRSLSRRLSLVRLCSVLLFTGAGNTRGYLVSGMSDSGGTLLWGVNVAANAVKWFMGSSFSYINAYVAKTCKHTMLFSCPVVWRLLVLATASMLIVLGGRTRKINQYLYKTSLNPYLSGWQWVAIARVSFCPLLSSGGDPQVHRYVGLQLYN